MNRGTIPRSKRTLNVCFFMALSSLLMSASLQAAELKFDEKQFTLSFAGENVDVHELEHELYDKYGITLEVYDRKGQDHRHVSDKFQELHLPAALDRLFGKNNYHYFFKGDNPASVLTMKPEAQPEKVQDPNLKLPTMAKNPSLNTKIRDGMKAAKAIKAVDPRYARGGMNTPKLIRVTDSSGPQKPLEFSSQEIKDSHIRLKLSCNSKEFLALQAVVVKGALRSKSLIVGDLIIALRTEEEILHVVTAHDPTLEHPFHHERDLYGKQGGGEASKIEDADSCPTFTISLPDVDGLEKADLVFYEYAPKEDIDPPTQISTKGFLELERHLNVRGIISGSTIVSTLKE